MNYKTIYTKHKADSLFAKSVVICKGHNYEFLTPFCSYEAALGFAYFLKQRLPMSYKVRTIHAGKVRIRNDKTSF